MKLWTLFIAITILLSGLETRAVEPLATQEQEGTSMRKKQISSTTRPSLTLPRLIPREVLFGNPQRASPQISPDGKFLAYLAPDANNVLQVWVRTVGKEDDRTVTVDKRRGIRIYFWAYDKQHLLYAQDSDGDENWHVYSVNLETKIVRDLTPFQDIRAEVIARNPLYPDQLLVGMNLRDRRVMDVYRINIHTGSINLDTENLGNVVSWEADAKFQIRAAEIATPKGGSDLYVRQAIDKPWKKLRSWDPDNQGGSVLFSKDGNTLYILDSNNAEAARLMAVNLKTDKETVVAADGIYDVDQVFIKPIERVIQAVSFMEDRMKWVVLDKSIQSDFDAIATIRRGEFIITNRDLADKTWLVAYVTDDGPIYYYAYHRPTKKSTFLFTNHPKLEKLPLTRMEPVTYQARDGLTIHGYLSLPRGVEPKNLPAVLLVHGGPWARDTWGCDAGVQWLTNRGYAVLQPNFRGSTGYGKSFLNAGNREWGAKMQDDLTDGVKWLIDKGIADPNRVAIMGGSYGGYAVLAGLVFTPDLYAAGVDIVGPSSIITLMNSIPPYWEPMRAAFEHRVGHLKTEEKFLKSRSPLSYVKRIETPLLIGQGANDPRVKQAESRQIVQAMRKAGKPVEYVLFSDEGHGFARPENRLQFYGIAEEFLAKYLGGRAEPVTPIKGSTGIVESYTNNK